MLNVKYDVDKFVKMSMDILNDNLVGIYLHGSYAMGCYNPKSSDIDLIVVIKHDMVYDIKLLYMRAIVTLNDELGGKGIEISVVKEKFCNQIIYPVPYELHFSKMYLEWYLKNPIGFITKMKGNDQDLSSHFKIIYHRGIKLYGKGIKDVFIDVPDKYYLQSILNDMDDYDNKFIANHPVYVVLNLCRTLAYLKEQFILSKQEGGEWALENTDNKYSDIISGALSAYKSESYHLDEKLTSEFVDYMVNEIRGIYDKYQIGKLIL